MRRRSGRISKLLLATALLTAASADLARAERIPSDASAIIARDAESFAEESPRPSSRYRVFLAQKDQGAATSREASGFPERGLGRLVPGIPAVPGGQPSQ